MKDIKKAPNKALTTTGLDLLDVIGIISSDKIKIAAGNVASYASFVFATIDLVNYMFEDDTSWLVEDLFSPGLLVFNRREQITLRYVYASSLIKDMVGSGALE